MRDQSNNDLELFFRFQQLLAFYHEERSEKCLDLIRLVQAASVFELVKVGADASTFTVLLPVNQGLCTELGVEESPMEMERDREIVVAPDRAVEIVPESVHVMLRGLEMSWVEPGPWLLTWNFD